MQNAEAGPSFVLDPALSADTNEHDANTTAAPLRPLPSTHFYSIEYPGYVKATSVPLALERIGGQASVDSAFKRIGNKGGSMLELNLRPGNPFSHPIPGEVVPTNNLVLKVVKRKKVRRGGSKESTGEYTVSAVGMIPKTARFRSMADYQYQPDTSDPVSKLRQAMGSMDVDSILSYQIPEEKEDFVTVEESSSMDVDIDPHIDPQLADGGTKKASRMRSNLRLPPPPLFSRQVVPHLYNYKANTSSIVTTVTNEETGEEKKRYINKMRWKGLGPIAIAFSESKVPEKPSDLIEQYRSQADKKLLKRLEELFQERPIWTRAAIFNQFNAHEVREIVNSKYLLPLVSYVFTDGPWRDTQLRLGYDPRADPEARFYQRLYFRNVNHPITRPSVVSRRQEPRAEPLAARADEDKRSHIFDGQTALTETAAFQLCDLQDPMLKEMVEDEDDLREVCDERTGWYSTRAFEQIKTVLRHKFFSLLSGHVASQEECEALLEDADRAPAKSLHTLRPTKHNMAKGALRPEDAAARRLKAKLDERAKKFTNG